MNPEEKGDLSFKYLAGLQNLSQEDMDSSITDTSKDPTYFLSQEISDSKVIHRGMMMKTIQMERNLKMKKAFCLKVTKENATKHLDNYLLNLMEAPKENPKCRTLIRRIDL